MKKMTLDNYNEAIQELENYINKGCSMASVISKYVSLYLYGYCYKSNTIKDNVFYKISSLFNESEIVIPEEIDTEIKRNNYISFLYYGFSQRWLILLIYNILEGKNIENEILSFQNEKMQFYKHKKSFLKKCPEAFFDLLVLFVVLGVEIQIDGIEKNDLNKYSVILLDIINNKINSDNLSILIKFVKKEIFQALIDTSIFWFWLYDVLIRVQETGIYSRKPLKEELIETIANHIIIPKIEQ